MDKALNKFYQAFFPNPVIEKITMKNGRISTRGQVCWRIKYVPTCQCAHAIS